MSEQQGFQGWDESFLRERVAESLQVIRMVAAVSTKQPLLLQFSGGRDSMTMLGLVREAGVKSFVATYMATGTELPGVVKAFDEQQVSIDFNHPLAGKPLTFEVEIIEVKGL